LKDKALYIYRCRVTIYKKYEKDLWAVEADRTQMGQVFMNILVNAWQAMPGGGEIFLGTENILLDEAKAAGLALSPGKYVRISVSDTGTGMDSKTLERIFDPFFTTKEMGRGTGLGLATVYGIIKGHGGLINVTSKPGEGTTFEIYLPATEKAVVRERAAQTQALRGTETILLVDDETAVLDVTKSMLQSLGYRVLCAGSGQDAIAVYSEKGMRSIW
jgi:nitrogen-specific signal transduction histidine kinase